MIIKISEINWEDLGDDISGLDNEMTLNVQPTQDGLDKMSEDEIMYWCSDTITEMTGHTHLGFKVEIIEEQND
jgi:hypothetical protein